MATVAGDPTPTIWAEYHRIIAEHDPEASGEEVERFEFYHQAQ